MTKDLMVKTLRCLSDSLTVAKRCVEDQSIIDFKQYEYADPSLSNLWALICHVDKEYDIGEAIEMFKILIHSFEETPEYKLVDMDSVVLNLWFSYTKGLGFYSLN
jgi:hypothetical protein